jgi:tetratricopeptide (TPR) repeat protein
LIAATPGDPALHARRGEALAELGLWADADVDFARAAEQGADITPWFYHALLRLRLNDIEGYRTTCARMLDRFERSEDHVTLLWIVITCDLAPDAVAAPERSVRAAERSAALNPAPRVSPRIHARTSKDYTAMMRRAGGKDSMLARALYRAGRCKEAVERLEKLAALENNAESPYDWLFMARAQQGLGRADEARAWLRIAEEAIDREPAKPSSGGAEESGLKWNQRLELSLLRREADALIKEGHPLYLPANVFQGKPVLPLPGTSPR